MRRLRRIIVGALSTVLLTVSINMPSSAEVVETPTDANGTEISEDVEDITSEVIDDVELHMEENDLVSAVNYTDEELYNKLWAMRSIYPQNMPWTPTKSEPLKDCYWFANEITNRLFDGKPVATIYSKNEMSSIQPSQIHIGDIIRVPKGHVVTVLYKCSEGVFVVEGNWCSSVNWGRYISYSTIRQDAEYIWSRFSRNQVAESFVRHRAVYVTEGDSILDRYAGYWEKGINVSPDYLRYEESYVPLKYKDEMNINRCFNSTDDNSKYEEAQYHERYYSPNILKILDNDVLVWDLDKSESCTACMYADWGHYHCDNLRAVKPGKTEITLCDKNGNAVEVVDIYVGRKVNYYNIEQNGGTWENERYYLNGEMMHDCFFCDGIYTYYLETNGAPMKDRLTYHPDGVHVIYFDENGHEVFSDFDHVKKSIEGNPVDDYCFFDVYGYMYVDVMTYDRTGKKLYYVNPYGQIERKGWFKFSNTAVWAGTTQKVGTGWGYGQSDGTLLINTNTYKGNKLVYMQGDGHMK